MKTALLAMLILLSSVPLRAADRTPFELTTLLGETYHGCRIIKVTPEAMTIVYDNGVSKVPFELLGDAWKELYHYDPDKAHEFAEHEEAKRLAAEERRKEELKALDKQKNLQLTELLKAERQREEFETKLAKEQADAAAKAAMTPAQPPQLAPFPGDGPVPQSPPIGQVYTPGQTTIITDGTSYPPAYNTGGPGGYPFTYTPSYVIPYGPRMPVRPPGMGMGRRSGPPGRYPYQR